MRFYSNGGWSVGPVGAIVLATLGFAAAAAAAVIVIPVLVVFGIIALVARLPRYRATATATDRDTPTDGE